MLLRYLSRRPRFVGVMLSATLIAGGMSSAIAQSPASSPTTPADWADVNEPLSGPPRVIGPYDGGCIAGAERLPEEGEGYQAVDLKRNRHYGHPSLVDYIERLGERISKAGFGPILVGDMAQPRGGPMPYGHVSHQTGLDVDIWFRLDLPFLERSERDELEQPILVDPRSQRLDERWTDQHAELIRHAADDPRVMRIFVDSAVKRDLCEREWDDRSWLRVIRPWHSHDEHLHVRLRCPPGQTECADQPPPPPGDGCQALAPTPRPEAYPLPSRTLPPACRAVLNR
ncbi:penicillin-insensitive murein endopeptidase [Halomonas sp. MCCC 1A17488]|uniref:penicillin-insensitive murein endopeptidase n=1 Tax=unclassified Halomonas TaxID=2609666 RepID=UPI0018D236F6|nr:MULTISPECIES: penicillin-insensitive murein endopeptidase [unclassified Halomonas]MCE8014909.1 penicillin-insensitive murein endopeptidase [Halomonas sp. MCCC 1A17488]MCG3238242.1 penicillin-insensitive murein endopeptidase [Halomonas sp. MCCC 1A17488]QPP47994.1 penicillin-insensitive murein endopeptidase [Halomonas sp. SS10-MC5]